MRDFTFKLWMLFFFVLFCLSLDYWNWGSVDNFGFLGLPIWIYYFILLQLIFFAGFYIFSSKYWHDDADNLS